MSDATKERRLRVMYVTPELVAMFGVGRYEVVKDSLPDDVEVVSGFWDSQRHCFAVCVAHPSFDPVEKMATIPPVESPQIERLP